MKEDEECDYEKDNRIFEDGAHLLHDSLQCNTTLTEVDIDGEFILKNEWIYI